MGQGWTSLVGECQFNVNNKYINVQKFYSCVFIAGFEEVFDHLVWAKESFLNQFVAIGPF